MGNGKWGWEWEMGMGDGNGRWEWEMGMGNGRWGMGDGGWEMGDGEWEMGGAGRVTRADTGRAYTVARGELVEAIAAVEIAAEMGGLRPGSLTRVLAIGGELCATLTKLVG
jgi:hypothetical protein